jgi:hypothetical protein
MRQELILTAKLRKRKPVVFHTKERFEYPPANDYSGYVYQPLKEIADNLSKPRRMMCSRRKTREISVAGVSIDTYQAVVDFAISLMLVIQKKKEPETQVLNVQLEQIQ